MAQSPLKTWQFKLGKHDKRLELFSDQFTLHNLHPVFMGPQTYSKPLGAFFTENFPFYPIFEEFKEAVLDVYEPAKDCSQTELNHWDFWKNVDANKIPAATYNAAEKKGYLTFFLEFEGSFIKKGCWIDDKINHQGKERIDRFFFHGPTIPGFSLKDRRKMKETIHKALNKETTLTLSDGFPLFNYKRIPHKKWEHQHNSSHFDFIEMNQDRFKIGGALNPKEVGSRTYSIEQVWFNSPHKDSAFFQKANKEIRSILERVITK